MIQAEELINILTSNEIAFYAANSEDEPHIVIGEDRFVVVPEELKRIAVMYDHNAEVVTFDCPRYWDDKDMSKMKVFINYGRSDELLGLFLAQNVRVSEKDSNVMNFEWVLTRNATGINGPLVFNVSVKKTNSEGHEVVHWSSELCSDMYVSLGLENGEIIQNKYPDIFTNMLERMEETENTTAQYKNEAKGYADQSKEYFDKISPEVTNAISTIESKTNESMTNIVSQQHHTLGVIETALNGAVSDIEAVQQEAHNDIVINWTEACSDIAKDRSSALEAINKDWELAIEQIDMKGGDWTDGIDERGADVENKINEGLVTIQDRTNSGVNDIIAISNEKTTSFIESATAEANKWCQEIERTGLDVVTAIEEREVAINKEMDKAQGYCDDSLLNSQLSKSYAVGTDGEVRPNDATDNSRYYCEMCYDYSEEAKKAKTQTYTIKNNTKTIVDLSEENVTASRYLVREALRTLQNSTGSGSGESGTVNIYNNILGETWVSGTQVAKGLNSVCYGNGIFVAVGEDGYIYRSTDSINWEGVEVAEWAEFLSVAFGNDIFVAVGSGSNNSIYMSIDGLNWGSEGYAGDANHVAQAVAYGNGRFVLASTGGIAYSNTGLGDWPYSLDEWNKIMFGGEYSRMKTLEFCNGKFILATPYDEDDLAATQLAAISDDGVTWTEISIANATFMPNSFAYGDGKVIAAGRDQYDGAYKAYYSTDFVNWRLIDGIALNRVCYGNGTFVGMIGGEQSNIIYKSKDGLTWNAYGDFYNTDSELVSDIAYGGYKFVAVSTTGATNCGEFLKETKTIEEAINEIYSLLK